MNGSKTIKSRTNSYWIAKYPFLYYSQIIMTSVSFFLWAGGVVLGAYLLMRNSSIGMGIWFTGWLVGGVIIFYLSLKYRLGIQLITLDSEGIRFTKRIGFICLTKKINRTELRSVKFREYDPFNLLTGKDLRLKKRLGRLIVNDDRYYYLNSYLYSVSELQEITDAVCNDASIRSSVDNGPNANNMYSAWSKE